MQKTFIRHTFVIITSAIFLIFFINFLLTMHTLELQQFNTFYTKSGQVIHTLETNQAELSIVQENLDEDYLTRARAANYVFDTQQDVTKDVKEMKYLAKLLDVDELHVIDENGIIISSSISKYVGFDMGAHEQSRAFLPLLESPDEDAYLIQEAQPNAADHKMMKYVGVVRKSHDGIVQVGFKPTRQLEAESRNTYEYIFSRFPTDAEEELFVVDRATGAILGHSNDMEQDFSAECYQLDQLAECTKGAYKRGRNGKIMYTAAREYNDILICFAIPLSALLGQILNQVFRTLFCLLLIEAVVILLLNHLVKRQVIDNIHQIIEDLSTITNGNLDTTVTVSGNQELEALSQGINTMVKSIINITGRISTIIQISGIPLAAFEYKPGKPHVFVTSGLRELLEIPDWKAKELCQNSLLFDRYIRDITNQPLEGETDIFQIREGKYVHIHMSDASETHLGVITDVSEDMVKKQQLQYENTHDTLTGLCKFSYFKQRAAEILQKMISGNLCAIAMLDLDNFKSINDTFGHDAGDQYLQGFSSVLKSMPLEHFLTARRSGDEFCMMIFGCKEKAEITGYLDEFYKVLENHPVQLSADETKPISASCGFACTADPYSSVHELLSHADEALYDIKRETKGQYGEYCPS